MSSVTLEADGQSEWLPVEKDQPVEIVCDDWTGLTVTPQVRFSENGAVHTATKDGSAWSVTGSNSFGIAEAKCEMRISTSSYGSDIITLRRGKV